MGSGASRASRLRITGGVLALLLLAGSSAASGDGGPSQSEPPRATDATRPTEPAHRATARSDGFANPFAPTQGRPGWLLVGLHAASQHIDGFGPVVGFVPWAYTELRVSYAYRTEHSVGIAAQISTLPYAALNPFLRGAYVLDYAKPGPDVALATHQAAFGGGLQARVLERYFLAAELMVNLVVDHSLHREGVESEVSVSDAWYVSPGFSAGVYLL